MYTRDVSGVGGSVWTVNAADVTSGGVKAFQPPTGGDLTT